MDPHFWPSIYPAIIVGAFVAFSATSLNLVSVVLGAVGGLAGGVGGLLLLRALEMDHGIIGSGGTMLAGALVAWLVLWVFERTKRASGGVQD